MRPVSPVIHIADFDEIIVAKDQDEYLNLPVVPCDDDNVVVARWELSPKEREHLLKNGDVYVYIWNHKRRFNPMMLQVWSPELEESK